MEIMAVSAQVVSCCVNDKTQIICSTCIVYYLFDFRADPFVHLLLLKSSMVYLMSRGWTRRRYVVLLNHWRRRWGRGWCCRRKPLSRNCCRSC